MSFNINNINFFILERFFDTKLHKIIDNIIINDYNNTLTENSTLDNKYRDIIINIYNNGHFLVPFLYHNNRQLKLIPYRTISELIFEELEEFEILYNIFLGIQLYYLNYYLLSFKLIYTPVFNQMYIYLSDKQWHDITIDNKDNKLGITDFRVLISSSGEFNINSNIENVNLVFLDYCIYLRNLYINKYNREFAEFKFIDSFDLNMNEEKFRNFIINLHEEFKYFIADYGAEPMQGSHEVMSISMNQLSREKLEEEIYKPLYLTDNINNYSLIFEIKTKGLTNVFPNMSYTFSDSYIFIDSNKKYIIKSPHVSRELIDMNLEKEIYIGLKFLNNYKNNFPITYGGFRDYPVYKSSINDNVIVSNSSKVIKVWHLLEQYIPGKTIKELLESNSINEHDFAIYFYQIVYALAEVNLGLESTRLLKFRQAGIDFMHGDLHTRNVLISNYKDVNSLIYNIRDKNYELQLNNRSRVYIIDYGTSYANYKNEQRSIENERNMKLDKLNPSFARPFNDIFKFLTVSYYEAKNNNIKKLIMKYLKFFEDKGFTKEKYKDYYSRISYMPDTIMDWERTTILYDYIMFLNTL